jgi:hypothetical protein
MSIARQGDTAILSGHCRVEDAEVLAGYFQSGANTVDVSACSALHGSVFQAILAFSPTMLGRDQTPAQMQPIWRAINQGQPGAHCADHD